MDRQDDIDRPAHRGDAGRQAAGAHSDTKARKQETVQGFVCASGLYTIGTKTPGTVAGALDAGSRGKVRNHGWMQGMRGKEWLTHSRVQNQAGRE